MTRRYSLLAASFLAAFCIGASTPAIEYTPEFDLSFMDEEVIESWNTGIEDKEAWDKKKLENSTKLQNDCFYIDTEDGELTVSELSGDQSMDVVKILRREYFLFHHDYDEIYARYAKEMLKVVIHDPRLDALDKDCLGKALEGIDIKTEV